MPTEEQLLEIHRLALLGAEADIARDVTGRLANSWLGLSCFREVRGLCTKTLELGPDSHTFARLARAKQVLGEVDEAIRLNLSALKMHEEVGDRAGQATTLNNIGLVYHSTGQPDQALEYFNQALPIRIEVGDRAGESVTRYNLAMIYRAQGKLREAVEELRQVVQLDELVQSPYLESHWAVLTQLQEEIGAS
jgi:tetratricopeptide (TPR) repeat protein